MVTSAYGRGNTLQLAHGWDNIPTRDYRYMPDYIYHTLFYISGIPYPDDLELVHNIREDFIAYNFRKRATLAVLEFVERFGANPSEAEARLDAMGEDYRQASELYLAGEFPQAKDTLGLLIDEFSEVDASLMEAKDRALVWIYLIEWLAVSGVGLLCGSILWMVMVRRKLYRSVKTTRIG
jgi:hypothetical protein